MVLAIAGCAGHPPPAPPIQGLPDRVELNSVPFFRGDTEQGASMALASALSQQGVIITPGLLDASLHLPGGEDRLQASLAATAQAYGMVVYPLQDDLPALFAQVAAGYPVLLRYTEGSIWTSPRYALLVGYDRYKQHVLLRSGNERRKLMDFAHFNSAWKDAGHWAVLVQKPGQLPANVDRQRWLKAANDLAQAGQEQAAAQATRALNTR
ncbi:MULTISPECIES: peptidase C39 family protein [Pseudomonas]|uniref:Peptidase C39 family protein n=1 Tax=Pseudomonas eucalypticola TaxID=2599595 RepID=A0A7D5H4V8_9PSED|nr:MULTISPECIES: peptidase C39 family protein [Pseudomonas]QKZ07745.1 peptidase C39 family protein [Pseudomonas eucalypticola]